MKTLTSVINIKDARWYKALTLKERILLIREPMEPGASSLPDDVVQRRLERWHNEPVFKANPHYLDRYLALYDIDRQGLRYLLGQEPEDLVDLHDDSAPAWLHTLEDAFTNHVSAEFLFFLKDDHLKELPEDITHLMQFLHLAEPIIRQGRHTLYQALDRDFQGQTPHLFSSLEQLIDSLLLNLSARLIDVVTRVLMLEINIARMKGQLQGDTPKDRYENFLLSLRQPEKAVAVLREYPVMTRLLIDYTGQWVQTSLRMIQRIVKDWDAICDTFNFAEDDQILGVEGGAGDTHRGGESVHIFFFKSGRKIVYKPRSLDVDEHFQNLLAWLNQHHEGFSFRQLNLINRDDYGWVEYVSYKGTHDQADIENFYHQQGGYLALLYLLHATDFHSENLIASGKDPILVDLEALFHPMVWMPQKTDVNMLVNRIMSNSVFSIGLLPRRMYVSDDLKDGIEISGLGGEGGQMTPHQVPTWEGLGTDEMRFARKKTQLSSSQNQPKLNNQSVRLIDYKTQLIDGFSEMYMFLADHRETLLQPDSPLSAFAQDEVRHLVRETRSYALRLMESYHPSLMQDSLRRERFLGNVWVNLEYNPLIEYVIPHELNEILNGDIPAFFTQPRSHNLFNGKGDIIAHNCFEQSGLEMLQDRLRQMGPRDLNRNLWFIKSSFTALLMGGEDTHLPPYSLNITDAEVSQDELVAAAEKIGDHLVDMVLSDSSHDNYLTWLGLRLVNERVWTLDAAGLDFYNGLTGIAHFLAYLEQITGKAEYRDLALKALKTTREAIDLYQSDEKLSQNVSFTIGAFGELGGAIYLLTHFGALYDMPELWDDAETIASKLRVDQDQIFDVISGAAGALMAILALYAVKPKDTVLQAAIRCGDHLLKNVTQHENGIGWITTEVSSAPLSGFSHGVSGISLALLQLAQATGEQKYRTTALQALEYERKLFVDDKKNWLDLREIYPDSIESPAMVAWCHGAPGIGIARLAMTKYISDDVIQSEIQAAIETTISSGFGHNHSICHGDVGNLELLLNAALYFDDPELHKTTYQIGHAILETSQENDWLCGVPLGVTTPGLMYGLAGIGYGLLRLAYPDRIPSLLSLEPPRYEVQK